MNFSSIANIAATASNHAFNIATIREDGALQFKGDIHLPENATIFKGNAQFQSDTGIIKSNIIPTMNNAYDIGAPEKRFRNLYLAGNQINFGDGLVIDDHKWSYLANYVVPPKTADEPKYRKLFTGTAQDHSAYIKDGEVFTFGRNEFGQLGMGDYENRFQPTKVPGIRDAAAIACGEGFTIVLMLDGTVVSFGRNTYGQLGDGTTNTSPFPVIVKGLSEIIAIAAGYSHSLFLLSNGTVIGFGSNVRGQLGVGDGTLNPINTSPTAMKLPSHTEDPSMKVRAIACGSYHSIILLENGSVYVCGDNADYQLGMDIVEYASTPGLLPGISNIVKAVCGDHHTLLIRYDGEVLACGRNNFGQLGLGHTNMVTSFTKIMDPISAGGSEGLSMNADAGLNHSIVMQADGTIMVFGDNSKGQLGLGVSVVSCTVPTKLPGYNAFNVAAGRNHTIVLLTYRFGIQNVVVAFGDNTFGQMGDADPKITTRWVPKVIFEGFKKKVIPRNSATANTSFYVDSDGVLYGCGRNNYYQSTAGGFDAGTKSFAPVLLQARPVQITCSENHVALLDVNNHVHIWGANGNSQLGDGTSRDNATPTNISIRPDSSLYGKNIEFIACGWSHTMAVDSMGQVHAWGYNYNGQLGDATNTSKSNPINISDITGSSLVGRTIIDIACGGYHCVALDNMGQLHAWGYNAKGQLGDNTTTNKSLPINISILNSSIIKNPVISIACSFYHTMALDSEGQVYAWGYNDKGQLGDNTTTDKIRPINISKVSGSSLLGKTIVAIACGERYSIALDSLGQVHAWGNNNYGQLGDNTMINKLLPINISLISGSSLFEKTTIAITCYKDHVMTCDSDGHVHVWGYNAFGQLGDNTTINKSLPFIVTRNIRSWHTRMCMPGTFGPHKLFLNRLIQSDGIMRNKCEIVGRNTYGQIGDGTLIDRFNVVMLTFPLDIVSGATSDSHSAVVLSDGSLYCWGRNDKGQCGQVASEINIVTPTKVSLITNAIDVACGTGFTIVLLADRSLVSFGLNTYGQLGVSSSSVPESTHIPTVVVHASNVDTLYAGSTFVAALDINGYLYTWGSDVCNKKTTFTPTRIDLPDNVNRVSCGTSHMAVVLRNGKLLTCGSNQHGQLGREDGFATTNVNPVLTHVPMEYNVVDVACGNNHTVVLLSNGTLRTFGANGAGQLGTVPGPDTWNHVNPGTRDVLAVSASEDTTYLEMPRYYVFGYGKYRTHVFSGNFSGGTIPYSIGGQLVCPTMSSCEANYSCFIGFPSVNILYSWGASSNLVPTNIALTSGSSIQGKTIVTISCGINHTLALDNWGTVHAWGTNSYGQLGDNTTIGKLLPVNISNITGSSLIGKTIVGLACGSNFSVAVDNMGQVHTWGFNTSKQLGDNTTVNKILPINISNITGSSLNGKIIVAVACGNKRSMALDNMGQIHSWGGVDSLPVNISENTSSILFEKTIVAIACGFNHNMALDSIGQVYAWGKNSNGELGDSTWTDRSLPVNISNIPVSSLYGKVVVSIACGMYHTIALDSDGQVHLWGNGSAGQLGTGTILYTPYNRYNPISLYIAERIIAVACGAYHTMALDHMGRLYTWGKNDEGQLGNNSTTSSLSPIKVFTSHSIPESAVVQLATPTTFFINFTGQHRCFVEGVKTFSDMLSLEGRIVVCDNNKYIKNTDFETGSQAITINDALPLVSLSKKAYDKRVFGVLSTTLNDPNHKLTETDIVKLLESGDLRAEINSMGEGAIWVVDTNGVIESGDYITTSDILGYGQKQEQACVMNYTVAKATMDCDFNATPIVSKKVLRDQYGKIVRDPTTTLPTWIPVLDERGNTIMEPPYKIRYIDNDGNELSFETYTSMKASGKSVFRAALIGCTYHCG